MVPDAVQSVVDEWRDNGHPDQVAIGWPRQKWIDAFHDSRRLFQSLPDYLDREAVREQCGTAAKSRRNAYSAFLTVMAWGYGPVGYGQWRVAKILSVTPDAIGRLQDAAAAVADGGALEGYAALADWHRSRLTWLGPAFGTKYLYFCSRKDQPPALILDKLVADWLLTNTSVSLDPVPWNVSTYRRYLDVMTGWSGHLGIEADQLEACIFMAQATLTGSRWGEQHRRDARSLLRRDPRMAQTHRQALGEFGETLVSRLPCPRCKRVGTLKRLPTNFKCADIICDFCGYLAQVKTTEREEIDVPPKTLLGAAWGPQHERMAAGVFFPLFVVVTDRGRHRHAVYYLPADLQSPDMFQQRAPLRPTARRAGWIGYQIRLDLPEGHRPVRVL